MLWKTPPTPYKQCKIVLWSPMDSTIPLYHRISCLLDYQVELLTLEPVVLIGRPYSVWGIFVSIKPSNYMVYFMSPLMNMGSTCHRRLKFTSLSHYLPIENEIFVPIMFRSSIIRFTPKFRSYWLSQTLPKHCIWISLNSNISWGHQ